MIKKTKPTTAAETYQHPDKTQERVALHDMILQLREVTSMQLAQSARIAKVAMSNFYRFSTGGVSTEKLAEMLKTMGWFNNTLRSDVLHTWCTDASMDPLKVILRAIPPPTSITIHAASQEPPAVTFFGAYIVMHYADTKTDIRILIAAKFVRNHKVWPPNFNSERFVQKLQKQIAESMPTQSGAAIVKKQSPKLAGRTRRPSAPTLIRVASPISITSAQRKTFWNQGLTRQALMMTHEYDPLSNAPDEENLVAQMRIVGADLVQRLERLINAEAQRTGKAVWRRDAALIRRGQDLFAE